MNEIKEVLKKMKIKGSSTHVITLPRENDINEVQLEFSFDTDNKTTKTESRR